MHAYCCPTPAVPHFVTLVSSTKQSEHCTVPAASSQTVVAVYMFGRIALPKTLPFGASPHTVWGAAVGASVTTSQHVACVHVDADVPPSGLVVVVHTGAWSELVHVFATY